MCSESILYTEDFINLICLKLLPSFVIFYFAPVYDLTIAAIKYLNSWLATHVKRVYHDRKYKMGPCRSTERWEWKFQLKYNPFIGVFN